MKYQLIYADPPWQTRNSNTGGSLNSGAAAKYKTMSTDELCMMPVADLLDDNALLVMWYLSSMPEDALRIARAWGFKKLLNMNALIWKKLTKNGKPHFGMGFGTRASTESALIMYRGSITRLIHNRSHRNLFEAPIPTDKNGNYIHSAKPEEAYTIVESLAGEVPRLEMFARCDKPRDGWDLFGDQAHNSIIYQPAKFARV